jgi:hypothetical protein
MKKRIIAQNKYHLQDLIISEMAKNGNECYLNHIDVSQVTDMSSLFASSEFNGDISQWDTSQVFSMENMFNRSKFNGDISKWDVSQVKYMDYMFCYSDFNQDLSNWKPYKIERMYVTFMGSKCHEPYWIENEDKDERAMAINAYHLKKGMVKELTDELTSNLNNKKKKLKV